VTVGAMVGERKMDRRDGGSAGRARNVPVSGWRRLDADEGTDGRGRTTKLGRVAVNLSVGTRSTLAQIRGISRREDRRT